MNWEPFPLKKTQQQITAHDPNEAITIYRNGLPFENKIGHFFFEHFFYSKCLPLHMLDGQNPAPLKLISQMSYKCPIIYNINIWSKFICLEPYNHPSWFPSFRHSNLSVNGPQTHHQDPYIWAAIGTEPCTAAHSKAERPSWSTKLTWAPSLVSHVSHEKNPGCLIGILIMAYYKIIPIL